MIGMFALLTNSEEEKVDSCFFPVTQIYFGVGLVHLQHIHISCQETCPQI